YNLYDYLDIDRKTGDDVLKRLTKEKKIIRLNHKIFISSKSLTKVLTNMRKILKEDGFLEISNFKKHLNLSRIYLISYLEYLDGFGDIINKDGRRFLKE
ncbi:MAG: SelB C-terminal domain-containing protein, partial [Helicobacter sp.]|nr:SelB C-terminal domain-containing protein [Helicobacter sp.]